jgi:hypothetical protein
MLLFQGDVEWGFCILGRENRKSAELCYISGACERKSISCGALRPLHLIAGKTYASIDCRQPIFRVKFRSELQCTPHIQH